MTIFFGGNGFLGKNVDIDAVRPRMLDCNLLDYNSVFNYLTPYTRESIKIVNAAAFVRGSTYSKDNHVEMFYKNSLISLNLMRAIKALQIDCYYLDISSIVLYAGQGLFGNNDETFARIGFVNKRVHGYACAKEVSFRALECLELDSGTKSASLILSNMYGPHDHVELKDCHAVPSLFKKCFLETSDIQVLGRPDDIKQFLYVKDVGYIISKFLANEWQGKYNVAPKELTTMGSLAKKIAELSKIDKNRKINFETSSNEKLTYSKIIVDKLLEKIPDFKFTSLDDGLQTTANWMEGVLT